MSIMLSFFLSNDLNIDKAVMKFASFCVDDKISNNLFVFCFCDHLSTEIACFSNYLFGRNCLIL